MARYTVLQFIQKILSAMDSDEVETITETIESNQVWDILERAYYELIDRREWEFFKHRPRQLDTNAVLVQLTIPDDVVHVEEVRYKDFDTGDFKLIKYLSPKEFVHRTINRDATQTEFEAVTINDGVQLVVYNDRVPNYWTSFDEQNITFDAYDAANEVTGLAVASSAILAQVQPALTKDDAHLPDMPERMNSLLLYEAMSLAFVELKQAPNAKAEQAARRHYIKLRELERVTVRDQEEINYGR